MTPETIEYGQLNADELSVNPLWWEIYEECFALAVEREKRTAIVESLRAKVGTAFHAHENCQTIAIARTHVLSGPKDFLAYIGVTESRRRRGVADALFRFLPKNDRIFEVEDPRHAALYNTMADACWKRIGWYLNYAQIHFASVAAFVAVGGRREVVARQLAFWLLCVRFPFPPRIRVVKTSLGSDVFPVRYG